MENWKPYFIPDTRVLTCHQVETKNIIYIPGYHQDNAVFNW